MAQFGIFLFKQFFALRNKKLEKYFVNEKKEKIYIYFKKVF